MYITILPNEMTYEVGDIVDGIIPHPFKKFKLEDEELTED